jgi:hypothetical protein
MYKRKNCTHIIYTVFLFTAVQFWIQVHVNTILIDMNYLNYNIEACIGTFKC